MNWRLENDVELEKWLDTDPDPEIRDRVMNWLFELITDPHVVDSSPVPVSWGPAPYVAVVPDTDVEVIYVLTVRHSAEQEASGRVVLHSVRSIP